MGHFDPEGPAHTRYTLVLSAQTEAVCDPVWGIGRSALVGVSQFEITLYIKAETQTHTMCTQHTKHMEQRHLQHSLRKEAEDVLKMLTWEAFNLDSLTSLEDKAFHLFLPFR